MRCEVVVVVVVSVSFFHCFRSCRHRRDGGGGGRVCGERIGYRVQYLGQGAWWESKAARNGIGLVDPL